VDREGRRFRGRRAGDGAGDHACDHNRTDKGRANAQKADGVWCARRSDCGPNARFNLAEVCLGSMRTPNGKYFIKIGSHLIILYPAHMLRETA
jgi:hypothetical protein